MAKDQNVEAIYPLLPSQQSLLLHHLMAGSEDRGFLQFRFDIHGKLCTRDLKKAWEMTVARHPALRSLVMWEELEEPLQIVRRKVELPWEEYDWRELAPANGEHQLADLLKKDLERGLDLTQAPLCRCSLVSFSEDEHHFVWSHHHMMLDGWSVFIVLKEVLAGYEALSAGQSIQLPAALAYRDYITWVQQQDGGKMEEFWRQRLCGIRRVSKLRMMKGQSAGQKSSFETQSLLLPEALSLQLQEFAKRKGFTLNTVMQGAWGLTLKRFGTEGDLIFGITVSGRSASLPGIETIVGNLANNLPFKAPAQRECDIQSWLGEVHDEQMALVEFEHGSVVKIQEWSELTGNQSLFDTLFIFENYPTEHFSNGKETLRIQNVKGGITTSYPLSLVVTPGKKIEIALIYDKYRFPRTGMKAMLAYLQALLERVESYSDRKIEDLIEAADRDVPVSDAVDLSKAKFSKSKAKDVPLDTGTQDVLEAQLKNMFEKVLGIPVGRHDNFFDLGGRSMQAVSMFGEIRKHFGQNLPLATLFQAPTVEKLAGVIRKKDWSPTWSSLVAIQPRGSRPPLFCFHGAEGNVLIYQALSRHLGRDQPVYGIQSQGLDGSRPDETTIEEMASRYVREIQTLHPEEPYLFTGYCMGGTLAFEAARQLQLEGHEVALVAVLDTYCDWNNPTRTISLYKGWRLVQKVWFHLANLVLGTADGHKFVSSKFRVASIRLKVLARVTWSRLAAQFQGSKGSQFPHVLLRDVNDEAALNYTPSRYDGRVTVLRSRSLYAGYDLPDLGWGEDVAGGGVELRTVPVYPAGMLVEPLVKHLAGEIKSCIDEALQEDGTAVLKTQEA